MLSFWRWYAAKQAVRLSKNQLGFTYFVLAVCMVGGRKTASKVEPLNNNKNSFIVVFF